MPYGKLITRFTTGGHDIFITFGLSVHAFCGTGDENIIPTCRSAGNYYIHGLPALVLKLNGLTGFNRTIFVVALTLRPIYI